MSLQGIGLANALTGSSNGVYIFKNMASGFSYVIPLPGTSMVHLVLWNNGYALVAVAGFFYGSLNVNYNGGTISVVLNGGYVSVNTAGVSVNSYSGTVAYCTTANGSASFFAASTAYAPGTSTIPIVSSLLTSTTSYITNTTQDVEFYSNYVMVMVNYL